MIKEIEKMFTSVFKKFNKETVLHVNSEHIKWIKEFSYSNLHAEYSKNENATKKTTHPHLLGSFRIKGVYDKKPNGLCIVKNYFNHTRKQSFEIGNFTDGKKNGEFVSFSVEKKQLLTPEMEYTIDSHVNGKRTCLSVKTEERVLNMYKYYSSNAVISEENDDDTSINEIFFKIKIDNEDLYSVSFLIKDDVPKLSGLSLLCSFGKYQEYLKLSLSDTEKNITTVTNESGKIIIAKSSSSTVLQIGTIPAKDISFIFN